MIVNSIKMIFAGVVSILVAQALNLDFAISAGIVAILTIQPSKRETFSTAIARFFGFIIAIIISFVCFKFLGITTFAFFVYLVIYIFVCQKFKWFSSIVMNSVLVSHFVSTGVMNFSSIANESLIFLIGVFFGILVNLHLHKNTKQMIQLMESINQKIKNILQRMSLRILDKNLPNYDGSCFEELNKTLFFAKELAEQNYKNQLKKDDSELKRINLKSQKVAILYEMYKRVKNIQTQPATAKIISDFLQKLSNEYSIAEDVQLLKQEFYSIWQEMKKRPLPQTRQEFEDRAELFTLLELIEEFL